MKSTEIQLGVLGQLGIITPVLFPFMYLNERQYFVISVQKKLKYNNVVSDIT